MPVKRRKSTRKKAKGPSKTIQFVIVGAFLVLLLPFYYGYVLKLGASTWYWLRYPNEDKNYRTYESFQIKIPKQYTIHGIDVSYYQGRIDWQKVKAMKEDEVQVTFAFVKATEGLTGIDPYFKRNWREAPKAGIKVGAYHFFRPKQPGLWQANFFLQALSIEKGDLPPVVDIEGLDGVSPAKMRKELNAFIIEIETRTKVKPIIYSGLKFYQDYLMGYYDAYPFWIAHYHQPKLKINPTKWSFWQHSDRARINGINHVVDFNAFNGDSLAFTRMLNP
ncbi:MAG: glycoside hydrolase family 25 protein [Bacteroidota bacterium]